MTGAASGESAGSAHAAVVREIQASGPMTVARFMEVALYDPACGYYTRAAQRSGRTGDFHTSVDVGPLFGRTLARLVATAWVSLSRPATFDVVEHAAGNGRLARDVLDALAADHPDCRDAVRLTLVERSPAARAAQPATLGPHVASLTSAGADGPRNVCGIVLANELLDALPVHRVVAAPGGLREAYVALDRHTLVLVDGPLSTPRLARYFDEAGCVPEPGGVADVSLAAIDWCQATARSLGAGYLTLIDYGRTAGRLYGGRQPGTLRAFSRHHVDPPWPQGGEASRPPPPPGWLAAPGDRDITSHVDLTAVERALITAGLVRHALVPQSRFLASLGLASLLEAPGDRSLAAVRGRLAATALMSPEGIGASHQVLLMATPATSDLPFLFA